jgi:hypothetical protein
VSAGAPEIIAPAPDPSAGVDARRWFAEVAEGLRRGVLAPYLGPGVSALAGAAAPTTHAALADFFGRKVALPRRARGNAWAAAQYIEGQRHRSTLIGIMAEAFAAHVPPQPFHRRLAELRLPLIVDTWYDGAMRAALGARSDWVELQGITRAAVAERRWYAAYDPAGRPRELQGEVDDRTVLYKPHGSVSPAKNFLIADSDYVEVLTEIDIQTPIPEVVRARREHLGFVFLGCRFDDQMLRSYARQIIKRSRGPHRALVEPSGLTRNERRFLRESGIEVLACSLAEGLERLVSAL